MSLHNLANHLQKAGRNGDTVLVHMTPKEVGGLQALAMAHGSSLTINPHTGLPEAFSLKGFLPTLIGAGLTIASGGALSPLMAAGITGAGYGLATGSLKEGLMAGLGAYGGAGLAGSLGAAGAAANAGAAGATTATSASQAALNSQAGQLAATAPSPVISNASNVVGGGASTVTGSGAINASSLSQPLTVSNASSYTGGLPSTVNIPQATQVALQAPVVVPPVQSVLGGGAQGVAEKAAIEQSIAKQAAVKQAAAKQAASAPTWGNVKAGFKDVTSSGDKAWNFVKENPMPFIGLGVNALSGMGGNKGVNAPPGSPAYIRPYDYSVAQDPNAYVPNESTAERTYFTTPRFTARPIERVAKEGGLMALSKYAVGGPVEEIAAQNSISGNTMYPQSQLQTSMYSNPMVSRPMPNNVVTAGVDAPINPYTGEVRMASGGIATPNGGDVQGGGPLAQLIRQAVRQTGMAVTSTPSSYTAPTQAAAYTPQVQNTYAPDTSMVPNTPMQPLRTPEQQLGLDSFYSNMNQRLADQGGYSSYAEGGVARYNVGGSLTPWATGSSYNPGVPIASGQLYLGNPPPMASGRAVSQPINTGPSSYTAPKALDPYMPQGQGAYDPDTSMVPKTQMRPLSTPEQQLGLDNFYASMNQRLGQAGGYAPDSYAAGGGVSHLGDYSDGGRLLKGPGDGVSDSIPASIGNRQPARLADGEFVVPARIVSELGNGSTEAGAKRLYAMMDRVQKARRKTVGKNKVAVNSKADKFLPA